MAAIPLRIDGRQLKPHKCIVHPLLGTRTVLTNSPWGFVSSWLKRERKEDALFFWNQARNFHLASSGIALESAPLLHYYTFMNATKALLVAKGVPFQPTHGVRAYHSRRGGRVSLFNECVRIMNSGVLPALSGYLGETEAQMIHTLQELLFNLPYVHRTYCLTYKSQKDMFIPLTDCDFVVDPVTKVAYFRGNLSKDFAHARYTKSLPSTFIPNPLGDTIRSIRSAATTTLTNKDLRSAGDRSNVARLNQAIRVDLQYINGAQTLWYAKSVVTGPRRLARYPLTLTLAAMHRLSELCRYKPMELASLLAGQKNWLLSEFIQLAPSQFIDELGAEITGHQFLALNVRAAT